MKNLLISASAVAAIACPGAAQASDCHPDFGDKTLNWVKNDVERQSRELARSDYDGRTFNYRLVGYERLHARLAQIERDLDDIARRIHTLDQSQRTDVALAVQRELVSEQLLTKLYELSAHLQSVRQQNSIILSATSLQSFRLESYGAVGRETLIASMRELGASSAASLGGRYGVYVQVNFDENGNPQSGHAQTTGGELTGIGVTLISTGNPYAMAAGAVLIVGGAVINESCRQRWDQQREKMVEAARLLPSKLITEPEQWAAFQSAEQAAIGLFRENGQKVDVALDALDERWKLLFAANAARAAAAEAVLTTAKIQQIRRDLAAGLDPAGIREQAALTEVASGVTQLNAAVARGRVEVITRCLNTGGVAAEENQRDAVRFSRAQFKAFRDQAAFVPLHDLLDQSDALASTAEQEIATRGPTATQRQCDSRDTAAEAGQAVETLRKVDLPYVPKAVTEAAGKTRLKSVALQLRAPAGSAGPASATATRAFARPATPMAVTNLSYCILTRKGAAYACSSSGGGAPYGGGFSDTGDPRRDIHGGANDAGFTRDARRLSGEAEAASINIEERIRDAGQRVADARAALPQWKATNSAALEQTATQTHADRANDLVAEASFRHDAAPLLTRVSQQLEDFVTSSADPSSIANLVRDVGGADMSLPKVPRTQIPPSLPEIIGVNAAEAAFGRDTSEVQREAMREGWKAEAELSGNQPSLTLSRELVLEAERVAEMAGGLGGPVARALLEDSASLRYDQSGRLPTADIAVVQPDGSIVRQPLTDPANLPDNALVNVVRNFRRDQDYYRTSAGALRNQLAAGAPFATRREAALDAADGLFVRAQASFSAGDIAESRAWLSMALATLDVATRFIPGVDWGRDVYEALSGRDLFSGAELDTFDRVGAVIGVLTAGIGNNALQVGKVIRRIDDLPADRVDEIYEFGKTVDGATPLEISRHARGRMQERNVTPEEIREILDNHTPLWSRTHRSYTAVGHVSTRPERIAVAVKVEKSEIRTVIVENADDIPFEELVYKGGRMKGQRQYIPIDLKD